MTEEEILRLESDQRFLSQQIDQFQTQFQSMADRLTGFETIQLHNDQLITEIATLRQSSIQLESDRQTSESRFNQKNAELKNRIESLQSQNQILSSMTSVLDRVTDENRLLESHLESSNNALQLKSDLIEQLKAELANLHNKPQAVTQTNEAATEPHSDWPPNQDTVDENRSLKIQLDELKANQLLQQSSQSDQMELLSSHNETLRKEMEDARDALDQCRIQLQEAEANRLKLEADLRIGDDELASSKAELERVQGEQLVLESNIESLNQTIKDRSDHTEQLQIERQTLLDELDQLRNRQTDISKAEASTETQSNEEELMKQEQLNNENRSLRIELEESNQQYEGRIVSLKNEIEELEKRLLENDQSLHESRAEGETLRTELGQLRVELDATRKRCDEISDATAHQSEALSRMQSELEESRLSLTESRDLYQQEHLRNEELGRLEQLKSKQVEDLMQEIQDLRNNLNLSLEGEQKTQTELQQQVLSLTAESTSHREEMNRLADQLKTLEQERSQLNNQVQEISNERELLRETLQAFQQQREQLVQTVQQKHQESVNYHAETLRLAKICEELQVGYF